MRPYGSGKELYGHFLLAKPVSKIPVASEVFERLKRFKSQEVTGDEI